MEALLILENISQDGITYFLQRARAMSIDEAVDVLNMELYTDPGFCESWRATLDLYHDKLQNSPRYDWEQMERHCHWAVICYLLETPNVSRRMNQFCRQALREPASWDAFPYKGLWFFLLMAFEILPPFKVDFVFRGVSTLNMMPDRSVPAVQFLSGYEFIEDAVRFSLPDGILITIANLDSEFVRDVSFYAANPEKDELLIWPFVTFTAGNLHRNHVMLEWLHGTPLGCAPRSINGFHRESTACPQP